MKSFFIEYIIKFENSEEKKIVLNFDHQTMRLELPAFKLPFWTKLGFNKCQNCPLDGQESCPAAKNIAYVADTFSDYLSYEKVQVRVNTPNRSYLREIDLQGALSSAMALGMAASDCPILSRFRAADRFHLPFSNLSEMFYRIISTYLLEQFLINKEAKPSLKSLIETFEEVAIINNALADRVKAIQGKDAIRNSILLVNLMGQMILTRLQKIPSTTQDFQQFFEALDEED
jgi:hypothetical protein